MRNEGLEHWNGSLFVFDGRMAIRPSASWVSKAQGLAGGYICASECPNGLALPPVAPPPTSHLPLRPGQTRTRRSHSWQQRPALCVEARQCCPIPTAVRLQRPLGTRNSSNVG